MKKMKPLLVVIGLVCLLLPQRNYAQTQEEQNLKKYWEARDRLKKYFMRIGDNPGESIPSGRLNRKNHNTLRWGDATTQLGWYMMVLATEYKLLKDEGQPTKDTEIELFFAINAIKRLDAIGEKNYAARLLDNDNVGNMENGWFGRDDVPPTFKNNWQNVFQIAGTHSDFFNPDDQNNAQFDFFTPANEPSLDQAIALLLGFRFIAKYVDDVHVNPRNIPNGGFNLVTEVKAITDRIANRWLEFKDNKKNDFSGTNPKGTSITKKNYCFGNPITGTKLISNHDDVSFCLGVPLLILAHEITGNNYEDWFQLQFGNDVNVIFRVPYWKMREFFYRKILKTDNQFFCIDMAEFLADPVYEVTPGPSFNIFGSSLIEVVRNLYAQAAGITYAEAEQDLTICWTEVVQDKDRIMNKRLLYNVCSGISANNFDYNDENHYPGDPNYASINDIRDLSTDEGFQINALIIAVLNQFALTNDEINTFKDKLNTMPLCDGPFTYTSDPEPGVPLSGNGGFWGSDNAWLPTGGDPNFDQGSGPIGNKPALDYMILYNLFRMAMKLQEPQQTLPIYTPEVICPCKSTKFVEVSNIINNGDLEIAADILLPNHGFDLNGVKTILPYNFDYNDIGLNLEKYHIQDLNINFASLLELKEDVKACNNSKTFVSNTGKLKVGDATSNKNVTFRFTRGTELILQANGILEIQDNSRVVIEPGATLQVLANSVIDLKGPNSILEIRGKLDIQAGATFQTTGEGYVLFNVQDPAFDAAGHNIQATTTSKMIFETPVGTPKIIKAVIAPGTYIFPSDNLQLFKVENARIQTKTNASIQLGCYFEINRSQIEGPGDGFTITRLNFDPKIQYNTFLECNRSLTFITPNIARFVRIQYNEFLNCPGTIFLYEVAAHVAGNKFDHSGGIVAGSQVPGLPIRAGLYRGPLKVELNTFKEASAVEVTGSAYPFVNFTGNVATYPTILYSRGGYTFAGCKAITTFKCNYFENQPEAIFAASLAYMNVSTTELSQIPLKTGSQLTGGNNIFKNNRRGLVILDQTNSDPFHTASYNLNLGQNYFETQPTWKGASLFVDRRNNYKSTNYSPDVNGNLVINGNYWTPLLSTVNYPGGGPVGVIEKNFSPSHHFEVLEYNSPNYIVGANTAPPSTCPIAAWNAPLTTPNTFNPITVLEPDFSLKNEIGERQYIEIPFELDGGVYGSTGTTVGGGVFAGTPFNTAFNNGLNGMTTPITNTEQEIEYTPTATGLINMANLLVNTAHHNTTPEIEIYKVGYERYFNCLSQAAAMNIFEGNTTLEDDQINAALEVFNAINTFNSSIQSTEPDRYYDARVNTSIDKCHLYRMFKRYTEAQAVLTDMYSFVQPEDLNTVNYLYCHVDNEKKLANSEISWIDFENNVLSCGMQYRTEPVVHESDSTDNDTTGTGGGVQPLTFTITPNPATTQATVDITLNTGGVVKIAVFDSYGIQVVADINMGTLAIGNHQTTVPLTGLTPAVYSMVVYLDDVPYSQNFVKVE